MLVFDLHHDRMAQRPVTVIADVQAALIFREDDYHSAARQIGLSPADWDELQRRVLAGEAREEALPTHVDAMAGMRHGRVYALRNVWVKSGERAFVIALDDGKRVYVPRACGNLSVVRGAPARHVAYAAPKRHVLAARVQRPRAAHVARHPMVAAARVAPQPITVVPETAPVVAAAPPIFAPLPVPAAAAPVAAAAGGGSRLRAIPIIGWLVGIVHGATSGGGGGSSVCTP